MGPGMGVAPRVSGEPRGALFTFLAEPASGQQEARPVHNESLDHWSRNKTDRIAVAAVTLNPLLVLEVAPAGWVIIS